MNPVVEIRCHEAVTDRIDWNVKYFGKSLSRCGEEVFTILQEQAGCEGSAGPTRDEVHFLLPATPPRRKSAVRTKQQGKIWRGILPERFGEDERHPHDVAHREASCRRSFLADVGKKLDGCRIFGLEQRQRQRNDNSSRGDPRRQD